MNNKNRESFMTTDEFKKEYGVHFTLNHNGKMEGMQSLSTSCLKNKFCQAYSKDLNRICSKCYAQRQMKMYKNMDKCLARNSEVLTTREFKVEEMPLLNASLFRLEAFSDLNNEIQLINYFNLCKANKHTNFALWTKNPFIIEKVLEMGHKKPRNLQIVLSSPYLNKVEDVDKYDFVDKVFTVYDKDYIKEYGIKINCGSKKCLACKKCYLKNSVKYINEQVK